MELVQKGLLGLGLMLIAVALAGCESFARGPAAVSTNGTDLLVAICDDITINEIYGEADVPTSRFYKFVDLTGELEVESGTVLNVSQPIPGLTGTKQPLDLSTVKEILLTFGQDPDDGIAVAFGGQGGLDIPVGGWLQTDGSTTESPCQV